MRFCRRRVFTWTTLVTLALAITCAALPASAQDGSVTGRSDRPPLKDWVPVASAIGTIVSAFFIAYTAWQTKKASAAARETAEQMQTISAKHQAAAEDLANFHKGISIGTTLQWCSTAYYDIDNDRVAGRVTGERYFERLWGLHYIEYQLYLLGLIPSQVYTLWLGVRYTQYYDGSAVVGNTTQANGWERGWRHVGDNDFKIFIESVLQPQGMGRNEIRALVDRLRSQT